MRNEVIHEKVLGIQEVGLNWVSHWRPKFSLFLRLSLGSSVPNKQKWLKALGGGPRAGSPSLMCPSPKS